MGYFIMLVFLLAFAAASKCNYNFRDEVFKAYMSEKLEKNANLYCPKCTQDCESLRSTLTRMPGPEEAMLGRQDPIITSNPHYYLQTPIIPPFPNHLEVAMFAMGCFWGVEKVFWKQDGVISTAVGYAGGITPNPNYEEAYTGFTGHAEVVQVIYDPQVVSYRKLLKLFWEKHDPTQGMQQGEDEGTQYRSMIMAFNVEQKEVAIESRSLFQKELYKMGLGAITTQITPAFPFYYAEDYHQQYLAKRPFGYCGIKGTGALLPSSFE